MHAVPSDAAIVIETNDFQDLFKKLNYDNLIWQELIHLDKTKRLNQQILFLDSLFQYSKPIKQTFQNSSVIISLHKTGKEKIEIISTWIEAIYHPFRQSELNPDSQKPHKIGIEGEKKF